MVNITITDHLIETIKMEIIEILIMTETIKIDHLTGIDKMEIIITNLIIIEIIMEIITTIITIDKIEI